MLSSLTIQNVILIDRLTLEADKGLLALTGETGAGKSILLDALGLALGARADAGLVRHGEEQASVTASFEPKVGHPVYALLKDKAIDADGSLILRRTVSKDGRSKGFINDSPVSIQLLKEAGALLVEIHGQFETQGLLDPATHLATLDNYAGIAGDTAVTRAAWKLWRQAKDKLDRAMTDIEAARLQEEYLKYTVAELEKLDPQPGEEEILAEKRQLLLNREKMSDAFQTASDIIEGEDGAQAFAAHVPHMEGFHRRYMASNRALRAWARMVRGLDIETIAPQHGAMLRGRPVVEAFLGWCEGLACGIDLLEESGYRVPTGARER